MTLQLKLCVLHGLCLLGLQSSRSVGLTSVLLLKNLLTWLLFRSVPLLLFCNFKLLPLGVNCWNGLPRFQMVGWSICLSSVLHSTIIPPLLFVFLSVLWSSSFSAGLPRHTGFSRGWRYHSGSRRLMGLRPWLTNSYLILIFTCFSLKDKDK